MQNHTIKNTGLIEKMRLAHNTQKLSDMLKKKNKQQQQLSDMFVKMFLKNL